MVAVCCVKGCQKENYGDGGTSFHKFPSDEKRRQQWIKSLPETKFTPNSVVCDKHFRPDDFCIAYSHRMLKVSAVPSVLPVLRTDVKQEVSEVIQTKNVMDYEEDCKVEFLEEEYLEEYGISDDVVSEVVIANEDVSEVGVSNEDVSEVGVSNEDVSEGEVSNEDVSEAEGSNENVSEAEVNNGNISEAEVSNEDFSNVEVSNEDVSEEDTKDQPNETSPVIIQPFLQGSITSTSLVAANLKMLKIRKQSAQIEKMKKRVDEQKSQIKLLSTQIQRRNSKVSLLENTIDCLKRNLIRCYDESLLEKGSQPKSFNFVRRQPSSEIVKLKKNYLAEIRKLALSLNLLSPKAYQFIRNTYQTSLPNPRTLNKWYQSANAGMVPGSKVQTLKNIWSGVKKEVSNEADGQSDAATDRLLQENYNENDMEL